MATQPPGSGDGSSEPTDAPLAEAIAGLANGPPSLGASLDEAEFMANMFGGPVERPSIGRYSITKRLGRGGMGEVFAGHDESLDRPVAIKLLHADPQRDTEESRARMIHEAKVLAKLRHPNVVQVYEVGEADGRVFIAMELVRGATLREASARERPGWRVVLERYLLAGRGLAAVHRAGLVHRDFKPDNVLVGEDGRVCVADFGLARHASLPSSSQGAGSTTETSADPALTGKQGWVDRLTRTGRIAGTPAYMAPEQLDGADVDALADQFAFCVALYEGLYGRRPFRGRTLGALAEAHHSGPIVPSRRSKVPRRLWRVLARGLAFAREDRYPSMEALLRASDPVRARWRRVGLAGAVLGPMAVATGVALWPEVGPRCELDPSALAEAWNEERREQVRAGFLATGLPFAEPALHNVEDQLDRWSDGWLRARQGACEATHVEGTQSMERLDARVACLERQRRAVAVSTEVLASADASIVGRSDRVLAELPDVAACAELELVDERFPRPSDPEQARAIDAAWDQVTRGVALLESDQIAKVDALSARLAATVDELDHPPLSLAAASLAGRLLFEHDDLEAGVAALQDVAWKAEALHLDDMAATARVQLAARVADKWSQPEKERWLVSEAEAAFARVDRPNDSRQLDLAIARGRVLMGEGRYDEAIEGLERDAKLASERGRDRRWQVLTMTLADALKQRGEHERAARELQTALEVVQASHGPRSPLAGDFHFNLGVLALETSRAENAEQHLELARSIYEQTFGADSLDAARVRFARAKLAMDRGHFDQARTMIEDAASTLERVLGPWHLETTRALTALGVLQYYAGDYAGSLESYERALTAVRRVFGPHHQDVGLLVSNIGESLLAMGRPTEALVSFDEALLIMRTDLPAEHRLLALPSKGRGLALLELGRVDEAIAELERTLAIHDAGAGEPIEHAETRFALARALRSRNEDRALALGIQAQDDFERLGLQARLESVRSWLAEPDQ